VAIWIMNGTAILSGAIVANVSTDGQSQGANADYPRTE
jgi:hypothetical protein